MRIHYGPGLRKYFSIQENNTILLLLAAGAKSTQTKNIEKAASYLREVKDGYRN